MKKLVLNLFMVLSFLLVSYSGVSAQKNEDSLVLIPNEECYFNLGYSDIMNHVQYDTSVNYQLSRVNGYLSDYLEGVVAAIKELYNYTADDGGSGNNNNGFLPDRGGNDDWLNGWIAITLEGYKEFFGDEDLGPFNNYR